MIISPAQPARTTRPTLILACCWALGIGGTTMMPLLVTNVMTRLRLDEGHATMLAGAEMLGMLVGCIVLPALARRWPSRITAAALVLLVWSQVLSALIVAAPAFAAVRFAAGFCEAQMLVMVGICLACHRDAERLWGVVLLLSGLAVAGAFTLLTLLPGVTEGSGIWYGLALLAALLALGAVRVPTLMPAAPSRRHAGRQRGRGEVWLVWGVFLGVYSVQAGVWAVSALQGQRIGLSLPAIGMLLSLSSLLGFFGALVPALPGLAARRGLTVLAALAVMAASVAGFFTAHSAAAFFVAQLTLNAAFYTVMAILNSFISARDSNGTLLSQSVVVTFAAVALGTVGAGTLFQELGDWGVIVFSLLALGASVPLGLKALRGHARISSASAASV